MSPKSLLQFVFQKIAGKQCISPIVHCKSNFIETAPVNDRKRTLRRKNARRTGCGRRLWSGTVSASDGSFCGPSLRLCLPKRFGFSQCWAALISRIFCSTWRARASALRAAGGPFSGRRQMDLRRTEKWRRLCGAILGSSILSLLAGGGSGGSRRPD